MRRRLLVIMVFVTTALITLSVGCGTISKNASVLNKKVSEGIQKNQSNFEIIITNLANIERKALSDGYATIYDKTEDTYRNKISKPRGGAAQLTPSEIRDIAVIFGKTYFDLKEEIDSKEKQLILQSQQNSEKLIQMNDMVTRYLLSLEKMDSAKKNIANQVGKLTGVDLPSLIGIVRGKIDNI